MLLPEGSTLTDANSKAITDTNMTPNLMSTQMKNSTYSKPKTGTKNKAVIDEKWHWHQILPNLLNNIGLNKRAYSCFCS